MKTKSLFRRNRFIPGFMLITAFLLLNAGCNRRPSAEKLLDGTWVIVGPQPAWEIKLLLGEIDGKSDFGYMGSGAAGDIFVPAFSYMGTWTMQGDQLHLHIQERNPSGASLDRWMKNLKEEVDRLEPAFGKKFVQERLSYGRTFLVPPDAEVFKVRLKDRDNQMMTIEFPSGESYVFERTSRP